MMKTSSATLSRPAIAVEWLVVALLAWQVALAIPEHLGDQCDFNHYFYLAGSKVACGSSPYDFVSPWGDRFMYPPWFALLMVPLSLLPMDLAANCWLAINLGALAGIVVLAKRLAGLRIGLRHAIILLLALALWRPTALHLAYGQHSLLPTAAALGAVLALHLRRPWLAGCLLVMATSKPQLAILLVPGLCLWEWRQHRACHVFAAFAITVSALLLTFQLIAPTWISDLMKAFPEASGTPISTRWFLNTYFGSNPVVETVSFAVLVLGSLAIMWAWLRPRASLVETAGLTLTVTLLFTPHAQLHDYVILVFPLFQLIAMAINTRSVAASSGRRHLAVLAIASCVLVSIDGWIHRGMEHEWVWFQLQTWIGEERTALVWEQSKSDWRFIAMLLPLGLAIILSRTSNACLLQQQQQQEFEYIKTAESI